MSVYRIAPRVSVLLPVYNGGSYLAPAIESILGQTFRDFECLVLDDGSTDGSQAVAAYYASSDHRVRLIARENRGLVATLNELVLLARGELLARMDADDVALPDRFLWQVRFLDEHPQVVCVGGAQILIDEQGRDIAPLFPPADNDAIQRQALRGHTPIGHPTAMMRAAALRQLGGYREAQYPTEDLDLWLRLGEIGELANLDEPVLRYRIHSNSISALAAQGRQRDAARRSCEEAWARRGLTDMTFEANEPWRPTEAVESRQAFLVRYGWMAFTFGNRATSVAYGFKAVRLMPFAVAGWRLLVVALFKPVTVAGKSRA